MGRTVAVTASALVAGVAGYLLWPPGAVYWTGVADAVGEPVTMGVVFLLAGVVGAGFAAATQLSLADLGAGGALAYVVGMALIEATMTPDSPVHFLLYGAFLCVGLVGAAGVRWTGDEGGRSA
jgi:hypothetical protein